MKTRIIIEHEYSPEELTKLQKSGFDEAMRFWGKLVDPAGIFRAAAPGVTETISEQSNQPTSEPQPKTPDPKTDAFVEIATLPYKFAAAYWGLWKPHPRG